MPTTPVNPTSGAAATPPAEMTFATLSTVNPDLATDLSVSAARFGKTIDDTQELTTDYLQDLQDDLDAATTIDGITAAHPDFANTKNDLKSTLSNLSRTVEDEKDTYKNNSRSQDVTFQTPNISDDQKKLLKTLAGLKDNRLSKLDDIKQFDKKLIDVKKQLGELQYKFLHGEGSQNTDEWKVFADIMMKLLDALIHNLKTRAQRAELFKEKGETLTNLTSAETKVTDLQTQIVNLQNQINSMMPAGPNSNANAQSGASMSNATNTGGNTPQAAAAGSRNPAIPVGTEGANITGQAVDPTLVANPALATNSSSLLGAANAQHALQQIDEAPKQQADNGLDQQAMDGPKSPTL